MARRPRVISEQPTFLQNELSSLQRTLGATRKNAQTQQLLELTPEECKRSLLLYWVKWECEKSWALTCYATSAGWRGPVGEEMGQLPTVETHPST